jgi:hypothetical protein
MARESPAQKIARITRVMNAWAKHAPPSSFHNGTLSEFKSAVQPSYDTRAEIARPSCATCRAA